MAVPKHRYGDLDRMDRKHCVRSIHPFLFNQEAEAEKIRRAGLVSLIIGSISLTSVKIINSSASFVK